MEVEVHAPKEPKLPSCEVDVEVLNWTWVRTGYSQTEQFAAGVGPLDFIIGTDILFNPDNYKPVLETVMLLSSEHTITFFTFTVRYMEAVADLIDAAAEFGLVAWVIPQLE